MVSGGGSRGCVGSGEVRRPYRNCVTDDIACFNFSFGDSKSVSWKCMGHGSFDGYVCVCVCVCSRMHFPHFRLVFCPLGKALCRPLQVFIC